MSDLNDRLERDLLHIADRATPSSNAWEAIQDRISEQADQPELEITMLKPNPNPEQPRRMRILAAAAAVALVIAGLFAIFSGDPNETETIDSPTTTTAAPDTTAPQIDEGGAAAAVTLADQYLAARSAYDGAAVAALFAEDAFLRDDLWRDTTGAFLGFDDLDLTFASDHDRVTGVEFVDTECTAAAGDRARCTYTWHNAWTRALGDDRYTGNSFVFDIADGQITGLTHTFAQGPVDGFENHISEVSVLWLQESHPDDVSTMRDANGFPANSTESLALWEAYTEEFVASLTEPVVSAAALATIDEFLNSTDMTSLRAVVTESAIEASYEGFGIADADEFLVALQILGVEAVASECAVVGAETTVRCTVSLPSTITEAFGQEPRVRGVSFEFADGLISNWPSVLSGFDFDVTREAAIAAGLGDEFDAVCATLSSVCAEFVMTNLDALVAAADEAG